MNDVIVAVTAKSPEAEGFQDAVVSQLQVETFPKFLNRENLKQRSANRTGTGEFEKLKCKALRNGTRDDELRFGRLVLSKLTNKLSSMY